MIINEVCHLVHGSDLGEMLSHLFGMVYNFYIV